MRKLSTRLYAILAAVFCAFVISCALPAQANTTPDDPVEAVVGFIQSIKTKDVSMVSYFDDATKNYFTQLICESGDITDDEEIAAVRASLDDPDSIIVKKIAEEVGKNEKLSAQFTDIDVDIFREKAEARLEDGKAYVGNEAGEIVLVKERDGWKLAPEYFVK